MKHPAERLPCVYLLHIFKHQVEFPSAPESLLQFHNVFLLERAEHLQLPQRRLLHILVLCVRRTSGFNNNNKKKKIKGVHKAPRNATGYFLCLSYIDTHPPELIKQQRSLRVGFCLQATEVYVYIEMGVPP